MCVIFGAEDEYVPVEMAHRQREVFPQAEVHVLEGLGHWPFIDGPDAVRRLALGFLERHVALPAGPASTRGTFRS